jgi:hypothetical protein
MLEVLTTATVTKESSQTKQILRARVIMKTAQAAPYLAGMEAGWTQSLERLAAYVATKTIGVSHEQERPERFATFRARHDLLP